MGRDHSWIDCQSLVHALGRFFVDEVYSTTDWLGVAGIIASALTLFPLSILAIFKPRPAARALGVSLAVAVVYPLVLSSSGLELAITSRFVYPLFYFPFALVVGLVFYAVSGPEPDG